MLYHQTYLGTTVNKPWLYALSSSRLSGNPRTFSLANNSFVKLYPEQNIFNSQTAAIIEIDLPCLVGRYGFKFEPWKTEGEGGMDSVREWQ